MVIGSFCSSEDYDKGLNDRLSLGCIRQVLTRVLYGRFGGELFGGPAGALTLARNAQRGHPLIMGHL